MALFKDITIGQVQAGIMHARDFAFEAQRAKYAERIQELVGGIHRSTDFRFTVDIDDEGDVRVEDSSNKILLFLTQSSVVLTAGVIPVATLCADGEKTVVGFDLVERIARLRKALAPERWGVKVRIVIPYQRQADPAQSVRTLHQVMLAGFRDQANAILGSDFDPKILEARFVASAEGMDFEIAVSASSEKKAIQLDLDSQCQIDPGDANESFVDFARRRLDIATSRLEQVVATIITGPDIDEEFLMRGER